MLLSTARATLLSSSHSSFTFPTAHDDHGGVFLLENPSKRSSASLRYFNAAFDRSTTVWHRRSRFWRTSASTLSESWPARTCVNETSNFSFSSAHEFSKRRALINVNDGCGGAGERYRHHFLLSMVCSAIDGQLVLADILQLTQCIPPS